MYEQGSKVEPGMRFAELDDEELYRQALDQDVGGIQVQELLRKQNPNEMLDWFKEHDLEHLTIANIHGDSASLLMVMTGRVIQWKKYYKGVIGKENGIVVASFGSKVTLREEELLRIVNCYN